MQGTSKKKIVDLGRIRTCNLLIRSQTRYPLRHETKLSFEGVPLVYIQKDCFYFAGDFQIIMNSFLSVVVITHPSHG